MADQPKDGTREPAAEPARSSAGPDTPARPSAKADASERPSAAADVPQRPSAAEKPAGLLPTADEVPTVVLRRPGALLRPTWLPDTGGLRLPGWMRRFAGGRVTSAGSVIALLVGLLGFALVVQLRGSGADSQLTTARPDDLVRILSDLDARQERLRQEIADLEDSRRKLDSGVQGREAALAEARRQADELGILAGTLPAQGQGLEVHFVAGSESVRASVILDAIEELRGAGAEAMQIRGDADTAVRIVASSSFVDSGGGIAVDNTVLTGQYTVAVIGDPQTMQTALGIPGGVIDTVRQHGGSVSVRQVGVVAVTATRRDSGLKYGRPAS